MEKKTDFKALSTKAKFQYFWDYYKWPTVITVAIASFVIYMIYYYATYRDPFLRVIMIDCNDPYSTDASGFDEFLTEYGYDSGESEVSLSSTLQFSDGDFSTSYYDYQSLAMMLAAGDQDLFFGTGDVYTGYAEQGALIDLSTVLSAELLEQYSGSILYSTDDGETDAYPCAIELTDNTWLKKNNYYDTCYFGILCQTQNLEVSTQFAEFLLGYDSQP